MIKYYKGEEEITKGGFLVEMIKEYPDIDMNYLNHLASLWEGQVQRVDVPGLHRLMVIRSNPSPVWRLPGTGYS